MWPLGVPAGSFILFQASVHSGKFLSADPLALRDILEFSTNAY